MILRMFKMIVTSGFMTALEYTEFVFDWGSAPDPTGELRHGHGTIFINPADGPREAGSVTRHYGL